MNGEEKEIELINLSTGETVNKFCMKQFNDLTLNTEVIWDVLEVITQLSYLKVTKNESGLVKDVEMKVPFVNEELILFALKNFMKYQKMRDDDGISMETALELRRCNLKKYVEGRQ